MTSSINNLIAESISDFIQCWFARPYKLAGDDVGINNGMPSSTNMFATVVLPLAIPPVSPIRSVGLVLFTVTQNIRSK